MRAVLRSCGDSALTWQNLSANCQVAGRPAIFDLPQSGRWQTPKNGQNQRFFVVLVVTLLWGLIVHRGRICLQIVSGYSLLAVGMPSGTPCPATKSVSSLSARRGLVRFRIWVSARFATC